MSEGAKRLYLTCLSNGEEHPHSFVVTHCWEIFALDPQLPIKQTTTVLESGVSLNVSIVYAVLSLLPTLLRKCLFFLSL